MYVSNLDKKHLIINVHKIDVYLERGAWQNYNEAYLCYLNGLDMKKNPIGDILILA